MKIIEDVIVRDGVTFPKWPQCIVIGDNVKKYEAMEIIRRTDNFFSGISFYGLTYNLDRFMSELLQAINYPITIDNEVDPDLVKEWNKEWGLLDNLNYFRTDWINSHWVGGYHGWCSPEGVIGYQNNIGKYPEEEEIIEDLYILAENFPFLTLSCTIMSKEEGEDNNYPLATYTLDHGLVERLTKPLDIEYLMKYKRGVEISFEFVNTSARRYFTVEELKLLWNLM